MDSVSAGPCSGSVCTAGDSTAPLDLGSPTIGEVPFASAATRRPRKSSSTESSATGSPVPAGGISPPSLAAAAPSDSGSCTASVSRTSAAAASSPLRDLLVRASWAKSRIMSVDSSSPRSTIFLGASSSSPDGTESRKGAGRRASIPAWDSRFSHDRSDAIGSSIFRNVMPRGVGRLSERLRHGRPQQGAMALWTASGISLTRCSAPASAGLEALWGELMVIFRRVQFKTAQVSLDLGSGVIRFP